MRKFFVADENIIDGVAHILGEDVKHIYKVLRLKSGDSVIINNCCGEEFSGVISNVNKSEVQVKIIEKLHLNSESNIEIHLFQGFPKSTKMDLIVQKATELGVREITPIFTERVIVKNKNCESKKIQRWNKIALEACKQCKRSIIPKINLPMDFDEVVEAVKSKDIIVVPYENEKNFGVKKLIKSIDRNNVKSIAVIIGPEGGFADSEINALKNINSNIVTLGSRILRTETAGFVCVSLLMYELGDLGGID
ncbi:16S rRNA (uracil(1498)-N(3))-methyltransferase [Clostridium sp. cel8]|jgi:16S rRNA (uracil1498-N3)-methyltransferase|uniref:16S rRNA (uracil(1498)-N(3))-methyltransferase n=1 Tax=unclassified Clostridium TaxID=2614128 RepID=UPI0015F6533E|nr:16S rRNA (uracil(1498)-N(3))-methyltransferase [Clostridium sp. cel8]MBA5849879.1 16S rRNA (uracil(1498)-N(3))-methyltransferase [Clostridium sp. cel8]